MPDRLVDVDDFSVSRIAGHPEMSGLILTPGGLALIHRGDGLAIENISPAALRNLARALVRVADDIDRIGADAADELDRIAAGHA